jgi:hypothetical protein
MSVVKEAAERLAAALRLVPETPVHTDPGAVIAPRAIVLGPPSLQWETGFSQPTSARFLVYAIESPDDGTVERLWDFVTEVADAIDTTTDAVVLSANPAVYTSGTTELPAYEILTEVSL